MGHAPSSPARVYKAVKANNLTELQQLCNNLVGSSSLDAAARRRYLEWTDPEGRTPLTLAAQRNLHQAATLLLQQGADVYYVAPKRQFGGSALHEAVHHKHEAMVELLLQHGADPFLENGSGHTPMDLAAASGSVAVIRRLERCALFAGQVNVRVPQMKGFATAAKDRWGVVSPRYALPKAPGVTTMRVMLWLFKDAGAAEPRTKVWLDGAVVQAAADGSEAVLKLHPNHEQPKNVATKYDGGWLLYFRAGSGGAGPAAGRADFAAFVATCQRPLDRLTRAPPPPPGSVPGAMPHSAWGPPPPPPLRSSSTAAVPPAAAQQGSATGGAWCLQAGVAPTGAPGAAAAAAAVPVAGSGLYPPVAAPSPASVWSPQPQPPQPLHAAHMGLRVHTAPAPPPEALAASHPLQLPSSFSDSTLRAEPGESDEAFASRLSSLVGGGGTSSYSTSAQSSPVRGGAAGGLRQLSGMGSAPQPATPGPAAAAQPSFAAHRPSRSASGELSPPLHARSDSFSVALGPQRPVAAASPTPAASAAASPPPRQSQAPPQWQALAPASSGGGGAGSNDATLPSAPPAPVYASNPFATSAAAAAAAAAARTSSARPPSPAAQPSARAGGAQSPEVDEAHLCCICMVTPKEVGFLHGASVHKCVCRDCAHLMSVGNPCPLCREPIERILQVWA